MKIAQYKVKELPILVIDNFYTQDEVDAIWKEISFLSPKFLSPQQTGVAVDHQEQILKQNSSIFVNEIFTQPYFSDILNINRKLWKKEILDQFIDAHYFFRYLDLANFDTTLISRYNENDHYKAHIDASMVTALTWFCREPKKFEGGDFVIEDLEIKTKNNRLVLMPGVLEHAVKPVKMLSEDPLDGRFTMTQFAVLR